MIKTILLFYFLIAVQSAQACICKSLPKLTRKSAKELTGAYFGKIVSIDSTESRYAMQYSMLVTKTYKGTVMDTLIFSASDNDDMCGINAEIGDEWLITFDEETKEMPRISMCSRAYNMTRLAYRRNHYRYRFKYHENRYARKAFHLAKHDLRVLEWLK